MSAAAKSQMADGRWEIAEIRAALSMPELCRRDGLDLRKRGHLFEALCPFHQERTPSFTIWEDHAHCFGCGWHGSIFNYWMERRGGLAFKEAAGELSALAGIGGQRAEVRGQKFKMAALPLQLSKKKEKPVLPDLRQLGIAEVWQLAAKRGLPFGVVEYTSKLDRIRFCQWPQWQRSGDGWKMADIYPSWVITDDSRNVAQFRRLDGGKYTLYEKEIKAWTKGNPGWPVGASELAGESGKQKVENRNVLMVEGGPDCLAAYFFLLADWRLKNGRALRVPDVAVVAMLGASCNIDEEALPLFAGKRVRIVIHNDAPNKQTGRIPSFEAAAKWTEQLCAAGAAVETFSLDGIPFLTEGNEGNEGRMVKDLNDLALCKPEVWQAPDIRAAFFDWGF